VNDFLIGVAVGVFIGVMALFVMSLMVTASRADEAMERWLRDYREVDVYLPPRREW
jgi:hypothetical protein